MSRTIEIPDEVYAQLEQQASVRGATLPQLIAELLHEDEKARMAAAIGRLRTRGTTLMGAYYDDSSALVKRSADETGSLGGEARTCVPLRPTRGKGKSKSRYRS